MMAIRGQRERRRGTSDVGRKHIVHNTVGSYEMQHGNSKRTRSHISRSHRFELEGIAGSVIASLGFWRGMLHDGILDHRVDSAMRATERGMMR